MTGWREMRMLARSLAIVTVVALVSAAVATAARVIVPSGTYKGKALKGASFTIAPSGKRASFHGMATVELLCGAKTTPTGPTSTGQSTAFLVLDAGSAPTLKIDNADGKFSGTRRSHDGAVTIAGMFSANAKKMSFTVKTGGMCSSSKYTFHAS